MDYEKLLKNKIFIIAGVAVIGFAIFMGLKEKNSEEVVQSIPEEELEQNTTDFETASTSDLTYILDYIQDYLNNISNNNENISPDQTDISKLHVEGNKLTSDELKALNIYIDTSILGANTYYTWHFTGNSWIAVKHIETIVSPVVPPKPVDITTTKKEYVTVVKWTKPPKWNATLSGIASKYNLTLKQLLAFPENAKYRKNPNLIHVGDKVRVK